jgi:hypothetical protein
MELFRNSGTPVYYVLLFSIVFDSFLPLSIIVNSQNFDVLPSLWETIDNLIDVSIGSATIGLSIVTNFSIDSSIFDWAFNCRASIRSAERNTFKFVVCFVLVSIF